MKNSYDPRTQFSTAAVSIVEWLSACESGAIMPVLEIILSRLARIATGFFAAATGDRDGNRLPEDDYRIVCICPRTKRLLHPSRPRKQRRVAPQSAILVRTHWRRRGLGRTTTDSPGLSRAIPNSAFSSTWRGQTWTSPDYDGHSWTQADARGLSATPNGQRWPTKS